MRRHARVLLAVVAAAGAVSGCGSTTIRHVTRTVTRTTAAAGTATRTLTSLSTGTAPPPTSTSTSTSTSTGSSTGTASSSAIASQPPLTILLAAKRALLQSGGYAMHANLRDGAHRDILSLTTAGGPSFDVSYTDGPVSVSMIRTSTGKGWLRANEPFWIRDGANTAQARQRARAYANRWEPMTPSGTRGLTQSLNSLAPGTLARCLTEDHGTLSVAGFVWIGHTRAVIVKDAGDRPGATPSEIDVAAAGTPYPLRYVATGPTRRGGTIDVCNNGKGGDATGTITLSQFGQISPIQPPEGGGSGGGITA